MSRVCISDISLRHVLVRYNDTVGTTSWSLKRKEQLENDWALLCPMTTMFKRGRKRKNQHHDKALFSKKPRDVVRDTRKRWNYQFSSVRLIFEHWQRLTTAIVNNKWALPFPAWHVYSSVLYSAANMVMNAYTYNDSLVRAPFLSFVAVKCKAC